MSAWDVDPDQPARFARAGPGRHILFLFQDYTLSRMSGKCRPGLTRVGCADWSGPVPCADLLIFSRNGYNMDGRSCIYRNGIDACNDNSSSRAVRHTSCALGKFCQMRNILNFGVTRARISADFVSQDGIHVNDTKGMLMYDRSVRGTVVFAKGRLK